MEIRFEAERDRAAAYDGETLAGRCEFVRRESGWDILHTVVEPAYGGQGLAAKLVDCVAAAAKEAGAPLTATCSYAKRRLQDRDSDQRP